jgi:putative glycerol-1-phosphate prenyltransferase
MSQLLNQLTTNNLNNKKAFAVLIDPDQNETTVLNIAQSCQKNQVDFVFVGGSILTNGNLKKTLEIIKNVYSNPVYIFPGNEMMIDPLADGILLLSLISGRNPEFLIGKHVIAAPSLALSNLDVLSTAYLLIDGGKETSVSYMSNTKPIPSDKPNIAAATALAGKLIGMSCVYLDAGSGALNPVNPTLAQAVKKASQLPLIIGGGIKSKSTANALYKAGADLLVIGNGTENNTNLIQELSEVRNSFSQKVEI